MRELQKLKIKKKLCQPEWSECAFNRPGLEVTGECFELEDKLSREATEGIILFELGIVCFDWKKSS